MIAMATAPLLAGVSQPSADPRKLTVWIRECLVYHARDRGVDVSKAPTKYHVCEQRDRQFAHRLIIVLARVHAEAFGGNNKPLAVE